MTRFPDWQSRLERYLAAHAREAFRYGVFDCCLFACGAIETMTGTDPAGEFRGKYANRQEAFVAVRAALGGRSASLRDLARKLARAHGFQRVENIHHAHRGDLVILRRSAREVSLGIVSLNGRDVLVATGPGVQPIPLVSAAVEIWRI